MAITVVGVGTVDSATPFAPSIAGPVLANDIIVILVEQASLTSPEVSPSASGYAHVLTSPVGPDSAQTVLSVLWARAVGGETSVTVTGPSNHGVTRTITLRGVKTSGNPWNVNPVAVTEADAVDVGATWPTLTTTVDGCLILLCIATGRDAASTANLGAVTGTSGVSGLTEQMDNWVISGTGGGIGLVTGVKDTAGGIGTPVATMGSTDGKALLTLALEPVLDIFKVLSDSATGADAVVVAPTLDLPDSGQATDGVLSATSAILGDQATSGDTLTGVAGVGVADSGTAAERLCHDGGPVGTPDCVLVEDNLTGPLPYLWDDPQASDADWLTTLDLSLPVDLRVSFPTPATAPGAGGPTEFQALVRKAGTGPDPTLSVQLWEAGAFVKELASVDVTSTSGQVVTATLTPADLTDPSGAGVELRLRTSATGAGLYYDSYSSY